MSHWLYANRWSTALRRHLGLSILYVLAWLNCIQPMVRFAWHYIDLLFFITVLFVPLMLLIWGLEFKNTVCRVANTIGCGLLLIPSFPIILMLGLDVISVHANGMKDASWEQRDELQLGKSVLREYRADRGATTSYTTVLRQELPVALAFKIVRDIYHEYQVYDVDVRVLDAAHVRVEVTKSSRDLDPEPRIIKVKHWVYLN